MKATSKTRRARRLYIIAILSGVAANVVPDLIVTGYGIPLYLDTIGTICVTILGGLFPGIVTALVSNTICAIFDPNLIYFGCINILIALWTGWLKKNRSFEKVKDICLFILVAGLASGSIGAAIQLQIVGDSGTTALSSLLDAAGIVNTGYRLPAFFAFNIFINILDKGLSLGAVIAVLRFIPGEVKEMIQRSVWKQNPLSADELKELEKAGGRSGFPLRKRITLLLITMSLLLVAITVAIGVRVHFQNAINERKERAENAARFAAKIVDPDRINEYIREGENAPGYADTEELLYDIRENAFDVRYLYIAKIDRTGTTYVFDLDDKEEYAGYAMADEDLSGYDPGYFEPIEDSLKPYLEDLLMGEELLIETRDAWGWMATAFCPVRNSEGDLVCYAGADTTFDALVDYMEDFSIRTLLILISFFALILTFGINMTRTHITYPTSTMILSIRDIIEAGNDQKKLDESLKRIRSLDIHTGDEMEKLYQAFCDMALDQVEQIRSIARFSENTAKMQDGLIITMADIVENRDSDTGAHIQKTAAYAKIIVEGLKKKGYYAEKITPKFISDVVRSAPLHDIGKINIPDNVLNKPGKLDDREYEIMKTHTTAGKKIMEKAIATVGGETYLKEARNMAAYHHERWDGKGYPTKLHGEAIPLSARIMAVADVFDALTSPRVYKPPFSLEKALGIIREGAGTQFDPRCVEVLFEALPEVKEILKKYQNAENRAD